MYCLPGRHGPDNALASNDCNMLSVVPDHSGTCHLLVCTAGRGPELSIVGRTLHGCDLGYDSCNCCITLLMTWCHYRTGPVPSVKGITTTHVVMNTIYVDCDTQFVRPWQA
mmetsp:Transcript_4281/g.11514  ORF Transcript_4281/g.11514 Transcript_4281/m.11514 type:complete len:111 (-) Transcript_4281:36-368(-)